MALRGQNAAGGEFFGSYRQIDQFDVEHVLDHFQAEGATKVTILSGTHGGPNGEIFQPIPVYRMRPHGSWEPVPGRFMDSKELRFLVEDLWNKVAWALNVTG